MYNLPLPEGGTGRSYSAVTHLAIYAIDFVKRTPVEKLYTFRLTPEVEKEFTNTAVTLLSRVVDKKFHSLEMLESLS